MVGLNKEIGLYPIDLIERRKAKDFKELESANDGLIGYLYIGNVRLQLVYVEGEQPKIILCNVDYISDYGDLETNDGRFYSNRTESQFEYKLNEHPNWSLDDYWEQAKKDFINKVIQTDKLMWAYSMAKSSEWE